MLPPAIEQAAPAGTSPPAGPAGRRAAPGITATNFADLAAWLPSPALPGKEALIAKTAGPMEQRRADDSTTFMDANPDLLHRLQLPGGGAGVHIHGQFRLRPLPCRVRARPLHPVSHQARCQLPLVPWYKSFVHYALDAVSDFGFPTSSRIPTCRQRWWRGSWRARPYMRCHRKSNQLAIHLKAQWQFLNVVLGELRSYRLIRTPLSKAASQLVVGAGGADLGERGLECGVIANRVCFRFV